MNVFEEKMWERREEEGERIGEKRGEKRGRQEIARKMVEKNLDLVLIKEMTGLTEQELKSTKAEKIKAGINVIANHIFLVEKAEQYFEGEPHL